MQRPTKTFARNAAVALLLTGLFAGCASDKTPPPFHTRIDYDRSRSQTFLSDVPPTNAPSTRDWKTNQIVGVGYGSTGAGATTPNAAAPAAAGAASSPSGASSGAATGVTSGGAGTATAPTTSTAPATGPTPTTGPTPGSGTPGTIIGSPPSTGIIGTPPTAPSASGTLNTGTSLSSPSPASGLGSTPFKPSTLLPASPGFSGFGGTNAGTSTIVTNRVTGQTNLLPGLNRP